ncbi:MAG TPA: hypothetical protein VM582_06980 [Candidatus Thermoplasmatota archaeon]|nr:hypothetical protein [Candidatus Thermoplasmatota archaeon]
MSSGIYLVGRGRVNDGKLKVAQDALDNVIKNVRENNRGVQVYEHAVDPSTGLWMGIEKYADNAALKSHLTNPAVGEALGRFMADLTFEGLTVVGDVESEVRAMMAPFRPTYLGDSSGFARGGEREAVGRAP